MSVSLEDAIRIAYAKLPEAVEPILTTGALRSEFVAQVTMLCPNETEDSVLQHLVRLRKLARKKAACLASQNDLRASTGEVVVEESITSKLSCAIEAAFTITFCRRRGRKIALGATQVQIGAAKEKRSYIRYQVRAEVSFCRVCF